MLASWGSCPSVPQVQALHSRKVLSHSPEARGPSQGVGRAALPLTLGGSLPLLLLASGGGRQPVACLALWKRLCCLRLCVCVPVPVTLL